jgi:hypothetical protein
MVEKKDKKMISVWILLLLIFYSFLPVVSAANGETAIDKITNTLGSVYDSAKDTIGKIIYGISPTNPTNNEDKQPVTNTGTNSGINSGTNSGSNTGSNSNRNTVPENGKTVSLDEARVNETNGDKENNSNVLVPDTSDDTEGLGTLDAGVRMVGEGVWIYGLRALADQGFKVGINDSAIEQLNIKENYGFTVAVIYMLATVEFDPSDNPFVQEIQLRLNLIGFFLILLFVLMGAINVNIYSMTSARNRDKAYILSNRYHVPINEYGVTIAEACLMMAFGYVILRITLLIELLFTKLIMLQILDRIAPTGDNSLMYLMMSFCYIIMALAIAIRLLEIAIFHASYVVFIGLYCFGVTRDFAIRSWWYYLKVLFMRPIIVGITALGVGIISSVKINPEINPIFQIMEGMAILWFTPVLYVALTLILVIISIKILLGISDLFGAARLVRRNIRTVYYKSKYEGI